MNIINLRTTKIFFIIFTFVSFVGFSQTTFEKGYFINNLDQKIECLIENQGWKNNPDQFRYKITSDGDIKTGRLDNVKEFEIFNTSKYRRFKVQLDRSGDKLGALDYEGKIKLVTNTLFLKVLIEGEASLFQYKNSKFTRYFYSINESEAIQLDYKKYRPSDNGIQQNSHYKQQLWNTFKCDDITIKNIEKIDYTSKDLINFFITYNQCKNANFTNFNIKNTNKGSISLKIRPGYTLGSVSVEDNIENDFLIESRDVDFKNVGSFRIGVEMEFFLPFNKNKFSIVLEPTYQSLKSEERFAYLRLTNENRETTANIDYSSLELPLSIRYNLFLNKNTKLFFNGGFLFDIPFNSTIDYEEDFLNDFELENSGNIIFGAGLNYKRYSLEIRYGTNRDMTREDLMSINYNALSFIFGYRIF